MATDIFNRAPPYGLIREWLGTPVVKELLDYAKANEQRFEDSGLGYGENWKIDPANRRSKVLRKLDDFPEAPKEKIQQLLPTIFDRLGSTPFVPCKFELELVAHGDGAVFSRHVDTYKRNEGPGSHRIVSAVYYFHVMPKRFSGGELRLHSLGGSDQPGTFVDIEPECDMIVFFPSWFPHEVLPVNCPSGRFRDSRFAINCWIHCN
jgi:SM-20-related protein